MKEAFLVLHRNTLDELEAPMQGTTILSFEARAASVGGYFSFLDSCGTGTIHRLSYVQGLMQNFTDGHDNGIPLARHPQWQRTIESMALVPTSSIHR
jgi:hypothetical protein